MAQAYESTKTMVPLKRIDTASQYYNSHEAAKASSTVAGHAYRSTNPAGPAPQNSHVRDSMAKRMSQSQGRLLVQAKLYRENKSAYKPISAYLSCGIRVSKKKSNSKQLKKGGFGKKFNETAGTIEGSNNMSYENEDSILVFAQAN